MPISVKLSPFVRQVVYAYLDSNFVVGKCSQLSKIDRKQILLNTELLETLDVRRTINVKDIVHMGNYSGDNYKFMLTVTRTFQLVLDDRSAFTDMAKVRKVIQSIIEVCRSQKKNLRIKINASNKLE